MNKTTYTVEGMTCGHCVSAVVEEVEKLHGVQQVDVDLGSGRVVVTSEHPLPVESMTDAVSEAGYSLCASRASRKA
jgi:copper ion binding protein